MASSSIHSGRLMKPFSLAIFLVIVSCSTHFMLAAREVSTAGDDKAMKERYEKWMAEQGRTYKDSTEKARRFEVFKSNAHFIDSYNAAAGPGAKGGPKLTTNKFADLTEDEFRNIYVTGYGVNYRPTSLVTETGFNFGGVSLSGVPPSIDWRARGAVTSVKDQYKLCACCWAFSSAAAVEGIHQITTGNLVSLSVQQLVDCSNAANEKCKAGEIDKAYEYIAHSGGLVADQDYPYEGRPGTCSVYGKQAVARISGFQYVPARNETALLLTVAHQPVSVALDGGSRALRLIGTGIFGSRGEPCTTTLNHAMTIVGYGTDEHGTKYWLMKNSWGSDWGDQGYVKFARDVASEINGVCGLALEASYPVA